MPPMRQHHILEDSHSHGAPFRAVELLEDSWIQSRWYLSNSSVTIPPDHKVLTKASIPQRFTMSSFTACWGTLLILSSMLGVVLAVFITVWSLNVMRTMLSIQIGTARTRSPNLSSLFYLVPDFRVLLGYDLVGQVPSSNEHYRYVFHSDRHIWVYSLHRQTKEGEPRDWKAWSVMLVFVASVFVVLIGMWQGCLSEASKPFGLPWCCRHPGYEFENAADGATQTKENPSSKEPCSLLGIVAILCA
ncbi:hypothetical protein MHU86_5094 [Fragilaria crotonensis]|nr:hypothetical protein MHU86_5094 [Fragilaria crotonensis]